MHPVTSAGPLAGRADELALLDGYLRDLTRGNGAVVLIEGEPGIGKTTLVRTALAAAPARSRQVFWGTGDELSQELPLSPFLDALAVRRPSHNARRTTIAGLLRGEVATDRGADVPATIAEQLIALTIDETDARPVVLVIDDLQWADPHSIKLWSRLARMTRQVPLLLIGLIRPASHREDLLMVRRAVAAEARVQLGALDQPAVTELVKELAGGQPDKNLLRLAKGAAGNPFYLTELLAALNRSSGIAVTASGTAQLTTDSVPDSLAEAIADRLDFVSTPTKEVLKAAALLGVEFTVSDLKIVLGKAVTDVMPALDEARTTGVLADARNGTTLAFRHPLLRDALYAELSAPVRSAWHLEAGHALAAAGAAPDRVARQLLPAIGSTTAENVGSDLRSSRPNESLSGTLATQYAQQPSASSVLPPIQLERPPLDTAMVHLNGPVDEWMLDWLATSAEPLIGQAPGAAAELLRQAVAGIPAGTFRHGWLASRLADALYRTGDRPEAARVAERALGHATDPDLIVDLHWTLAQVRLVTGSGKDSFTALENALSTPGITPKHRARLLVLTARTYLYLVDVEAADAAARKALASAEMADDIWATGWALHVLAMMASIRGDMAEALPLYDRALAVTETDPALTDLGLLLQINKCAILGNHNRYDEALATAEQARQLVDQVGTTVRLGQAHGMIGQALFEVGRWDEALTEIAVVPENLKESVLSCCEYGIAAKISFHRNELETARRFLADAEPHAHQMELPAPHLVLAQSLDREQAGALREALAVLVAPFDGDPDDLGQIEDLLIDAVRLAVKVGDKKAAQKITTLAMQLAEGSEIPSRQANALYCKGMVDRDAFVLLSAAQRFVDSGKKLPQAKAFEAAAQCLVEAEDMTKAKQALEQAMEIYEFLDAEADINRLHAEFRQHGIRRGNHRQHRRAVSGWESLTETELRVVALVQEGLSNPEIAARLFTSRRTVGTHVSHILKKLSLTTRTDIARESAKRSIAGRDSAGEEASVGVRAGVG